MPTRASDIATDARDTFPKLLAERARTGPRRPAYREKEYGIWQTYDWAHVAAEVRRLAAGLAGLGFQRRDWRVRIRPDPPGRYWSIVAGASPGGGPGAVYRRSE